MVDSNPAGLEAWLLGWQEPWRLQAWTLHIDFFDSSRILMDFMAAGWDGMDGENSHTLKLRGARRILGGGTTFGVGPWDHFCRGSVPTSF